MKIEIRCCCNANKLMGYVEMASEPKRCGTFRIEESLGSWFDLEHRAQTSREHFKTVCLEYKDYRTERGELKKALSSDNVPLSVLERIRGFVSA